MPLIHRVDEWLAEPLRQLRCLHRHVGCLRPSDRAIQNKLEPASNNNGLHCQSAVAVAIGAKRLSGALSNAADPELVLPMVAAARHRPEQAIQRAVFDHLRQRGAPGTFAFHPPNGGWRSVIEAAILKGLGVVAGTPDVIVLKGGATYALELRGWAIGESEPAVAAEVVHDGQALRQVPLDVGRPIRRVGNGFRR